jgi:hypothetical protein
MARFVAGALFGAMVVLVGGAAAGLHAQDPGESPDPQAQILHAADVAGVDPTDLAGAVNSTGLSPFVYLHAVGELDHPPLLNTLPPPVVVSPPAPASGVLSARVECIIAKESGGANVANTRGSGAVGVAQYMPSTFAAHAREMGHTDWSPWVPWQAREVAAHDLALGRRSQWAVGGC